MTRFWITLDHGVRFVVRAIDQMQGGEIFVPKIPTMGILDLSKALAADCEVDLIGMRPGEKTHEVLVSDEEARYTRELDDMFVILPRDTERAAKAWPDGRPLPEGFRYASDDNPERLTAEALVEMLARHG